MHGQLVYGITILPKSKTERVHVSRLTKYDDSLLGSEVLEELVDLAEKTETRYEVIGELIDLGEADDGLFFQLVWDCLPFKRD